MPFFWNHYLLYYSLIIIFILIHSHCSFPGRCAAVATVLCQKFFLRQSYAEQNHLVRFSLPHFFILFIFPPLSLPFLFADNCFCLLDNRERKE